MKKVTSPMGIGISTILTVLLVLTLSVFAALTLTSARADLALSRRNAHTVTAYYTADAAAARAYADFAAGTDPGLEAYFPITETQRLYLHLGRTDGRVEILAWQAVPAAEGDPMAEDALPVWDGTENGQ